VWYCFFQDENSVAVVVTSLLILLLLPLLMDRQGFS